MGTSIKIKSELSNKSYLKIFGFLAIFLLLFTLNFFLPLNSYLDFGSKNITNRMWSWGEILVAITAIYYIFKIRKFNISDFCVAVLLGSVVKFTGWYNYVSAFSTIITYYSACQIFRLYNLQGKFFKLNFKKTLVSLGIGSLAAIPFAVINNMVISATRAFGATETPTNILRIFKAALNALPPGISEEIIWHFFLSAFILAVFNGKTPKNKSTTFLIYFLLVVPHCMIHLPDMFIQNKLMALYGLAFTAILFGTPMVWIVRNKNLQTASAFHWCVDFIRFCFGS